MMHPLGCPACGAKLHGSSDLASDTLYLTWVFAWCMTCRAMTALDCQLGLGRTDDLRKHHRLQAVL